MIILTIYTIIIFQYTYILKYKVKTYFGLFKFLILLEIFKTINKNYLQSSCAIPYNIFNFFKITPFLDRLMTLQISEKVIYLKVKFEFYYTCIISVLSNTI